MIRFSYIPAFFKGSCYPFREGIPSLPVSEARRPTVHGRNQGSALPAGRDSQGMA
jgi:hypothetical protein